MTDYDALHCEAAAYARANAAEERVRVLGSENEQLRERIKELTDVLLTQYRERNDHLELRLDELNGENDALRARIAALEKCVEAARLEGKIEALTQVGGYAGRIAELRAARAALGKETG